MLSDFVSNAGSILTAISILFAYMIWRHEEMTKQSHLKTMIKAHLDSLGPWMSSDRSAHTVEIDYFEYVRPFRFIYNTAADAFVSLTQLPSVNNMPKYVIGEIVQLYYDLVRIMNIQTLWTEYAMANIKIANSIDSKLENVGENISYNEFKNSLSRDEKVMIEKLEKWTNTIHVDIIGNGARIHWDEIQKWANNPIDLKLKLHEIIFLSIIMAFVLIILSNSLLPTSLGSILLITSISLQIVLLASSLLL